MFQETGMPVYEVRLKYEGYLTYFVEAEGQDEAWRTAHDRYETGDRGIRVGHFHEAANRGESDVWLVGTVVEETRDAKNDSPVQK